MTSQDSSTRSRPRIWVMPNGSMSIDEEHRLAVALPMSTPPGGAMACSRARGVHDVSHRRVVAAGQRADEHLAGVDADAHLDARPVLPLAGEVAQRALHAQAGTHGSLGVVLVGHRRAEQGDDAVAEQLVDSAPELLDVGDETLEAGLDQALDLLRVAVLGQRRVADEIGKEDGDDAPFLRRDEHARRGNAAVGTEARPRWNRLGARGTDRRRHARMLRRATRRQPRG